MKTTIRMRFIIWLTVLLLIFVFIQTTAFIAYEIHEWRTMEYFDQEEEIEELAILLGVDLVILPLLLAAIWWMSGVMLKPLKTMASTARDISAGRFNERLTTPRPDDELGILAESLNSAFDRHRQAVVQMQRFSSNASHQLRTPLTALRSLGEVTLQKERTPDEYRDAIGSMLEEVQRLSRLIDQMLALARLESVEIRRRFKDVDLGRAVRQIVAQFDPISEQKLLTVAMRLGENIIVQGDGALLQQVTANLVDNAIKFTPNGGRIDITCDRDASGWIELAVADTGPGIPEAQRAIVFERLSGRQDHEMPGHGLGLAIVADIVKIHGGTVSVDSSAAGGTTVRVRLPALPGKTRRPDLF